MAILGRRLEQPVSFPRSDEQWHSFLDRHFEDALRIKRYVKDLPPTSATFTLKPIRDDLDARVNVLPDKIIKLSGAWPCPNPLANTDTRQWVNPNYAHKQHYSDALVKCDCGIPVIRESFGENEKQPSHHQKHNPDCHKINRHKVRLELLKNRREIIKEGYRLGQNINRLAPRLGYSDGNQLGGKYTDNLGLDITELRIDGRKRVARTFIVLARDHSPKEIGELYDLHRRSVSQMIAEETTCDPSTMYSVRRAKMAE